MTVRITRKVTFYAAPQLDAWDKWNYARTDHLLDTVSARYVSPGIYGVDDLDRYGTWRSVPTYGPIWVPSGVPAGWVPYSTGAWVRDPYYGWTWVDTAAVGLGALSLWPLGLRRRILGLGAGTGAW